MLVVGKSYTIRNGALVTIVDVDADPTDAYPFLGDNQIWYTKTGTEYTFEDSENDILFTTTNVCGNTMERQALAERVDLLESRVSDLEKLAVVKKSLDDMEDFTEFVQKLLNLPKVH